ncbi:MAG: nucleoside-diphosphate kinase [Bacteroidales bacterium]|nr:MAG: nucleoside-diphosphate kinase [Bacteroidales bacterium]
MSGKITFSLIKPYAVKMGYIGPILAMIHEAGFRISAITSTKLSKEQAESFYTIHKSKPFFDDLVEFMSSGPIVAMILEKENAVEDFRELIGHTDPEKAENGTIRKKYAKSVQSNAVHGSDSAENAIIECDFFFSKKERY